MPWRVFNEAGSRPKKEEDWPMLEHTALAFVLTLEDPFRFRKSSYAECSSPLACAVCARTEVDNLLMVVAPWTPD